MTDSAISHDDYTVAWICPLEVEQLPAILMLDTQHYRLPQSQNDHNVYTLGSINGHNVVVASLPKPGNCPAATVITQMRNTFRNLRFCLLVGIGGGVPMTIDQVPLRLGHVVVSKPSGTESGVIQCDHGKLEAGGQFHRTGVLAPPPPVLLNSAQQMSVIRRMAREDPLIRHLQRVDTSPEMMPEYKYPGRKKDPLYDRKVQGVQNRRFEAMDDEGCPKWITVHRGIIATSEKVVKDAGIRDAVSKTCGVICFETEAAGALDDFPCLVIRGISDYADPSKNNDWQPYAAASAAAYARELFFHMPVDQVKQCSIPERDVKQMIQDTSSLFQSDQDRKIEKWLSPPNSSTNHNSAMEKHLEGTGKWFLESREFSSWKRNAKSALWVHGIPGCGKTILSSTAIQHLQSATDGTSLAYFFFDFGDTSKQSFEQMVRSLIFQLCSLNATTREYLNKLYCECEDGKKQPDLTSLCNTSQAMSKELPHFTLLLDALDECECVSREPMMKWLETLGCRILVTSRKLRDIQSSIEEWERPVAIFSFQKSPASDDIRAFIRQRLGRDVGHALSQSSTKSKLARRWKGYENLLTEIETKLTEKADGMFRWAACQLDALEEYEMPHDLLKALDTLPDTLDETYRRILDGIPQIHLSNSIRILQFLTHAKRPIKIREAVDILATTPENDPKFDPGNRMPNPQGILKFCSSLVTISEEDIQLAHFSVKEYLASSGEKGSFESNLNELQAHESITRVLIAYLSCIEDSKKWLTDTHAMMQDFPLAAYGAKYWIEHATRAGDTRATRESILEFFKHDEALFICTSLIFDQEFEEDFTDRKFPYHSEGLSPLYLASKSGWQHIVEDLLSQSPDSIDDSCGVFCDSALRVACRCNQMGTARTLLENGADVNNSPRTDRYGTPLMIALTSGHNDLVELLLEYGADPNAEISCLEKEYFLRGATNSFGVDELVTYPLILASIWDSEHWIRILLKKGALPNKTDELGNSALYYASWRGHNSIANILLGDGADIGGTNHYGVTVFQAACESGCDEAVILLLEEGRRMNAGIALPGGECGDALQIASYWGRIEAVRALLSYGVDPNHTEGDYGPALHAASSRGHQRVVELLLEGGSNPHLLDCHQWNAHSLAIKNGYDDVSKALWRVSANGPSFQCLYPSTFVELQLLERGSEKEWKYRNGRSDHPFGPTARQIYFQIKILDIAENSRLGYPTGIGLCCMELMSSVRHRFRDICCHSALRNSGDSHLGYLLRGESARWQSFYSLKKGDIIGCGVDYDSNTSFFTLNGDFYGMPSSAPAGRLFAFLSIEYHARVECAFSAKPPDISKFSP